MKENNYKVYCYTTPSNKKYIGMTKQTLSQRAGKDGKGYIESSIFYNAIIKYGWKNITSKILAQNLSRIQACNLEQIFIKKYKTMDRRYGYNLTTGGDCPKVSEHSKKLISINHADCNGKNNAFYGKHHTEETKVLISLNHDYTKQRGINNVNSKLVICFETLDIFACANLVDDYLKISKNMTNLHCRKLSKPMLGLHVMYYDTFISLVNENKSYKILQYINIKHKSDKYDKYKIPLPFKNVEDYYKIFIEKYNKHDIILNL